jgi:hypothetical protein
MLEMERSQREQTPQHCICVNAHGAQKFSERTMIFLKIFVGFVQKIEQE